jgi:cell division protein FtsI/penicillin-binding protein 2
VFFGNRFRRRPGDILDRNGTVLATTQEVDSLYAVPEEIDDPLTWAWQVAGVLNLNADELYGRLVEYRQRQFLWVQRRIQEEQSEQLRKLPLKKGSWGLRREYLRQNLQSPSAAHVLGLRDIDNRGKGGLEEGLEKYLRGTPGERVMMRDARGMILEVDTDLSKPPVAGRSVVCSIDLPLQQDMERQLDALMEKWRPRGACAIVMDPATGEILAMASRPAFDPLNLKDVPEEAWKNLAVSAVFEPGSTFKPVIVAAALQQGLLQRDELIDCSYGLYRMGPRLLHDHHPYGMLSTADVLVKSSNIGMAKIGERLGLNGLYQAAVSFGFGSRTGIELPGELPGLLQPLDRWNVYSLGSVPMGQELACTPLQLITAHAVLANGGRLIRPTLICRSGDESGGAVDGDVVLPGESVQTALLNAEHAEWLVREPLRDVVLRRHREGSPDSGTVDFRQDRYSSEAGSSDRHLFGSSLGGVIRLRRSGRRSRSTGAGDGGRTNSAGHSLWWHRRRPSGLGNSAVHHAKTGRHERSGNHGCPRRKSRPLTL